MQFLFYNDAGSHDIHHDIHGLFKAQNLILFTKSSTCFSYLMVILIKEVQIVYRLFLVNCYYCMYLVFLPSQLAQRKILEVEGLKKTGLNWLDST